MAFYTYPTGAGQQMDIFQWRKMRFAENPDQIRSGLEVVVLDGRRMRMGVGSADVGGMQFINDSTDDWTVPENTSSSAVIWRRVLRLTITTDLTLAGGTAKIEPASLQGGGPIGPGLTQMTTPGLSGVLVWEVPLARYAVLPGGRTVEFLTNDGPGLGVCGWARDSYKIPDNNDNGVPDLYPFKMTTGVYGPQPGSIDDKDVVVSMPGIYSIDYSVLLKEAQAAMAAPVKPYIRLVFPGGDERAQFGLNVDPARPQDGFAKIVKPSIYLPTGYRIQPRIYQNSGAEQQVLFRFLLSRTGVL